MPSLTITDELEAYVVVSSLLDRREFERDHDQELAVETIDELLTQLDMTTAYRALVDQEAD